MRSYEYYAASVLLAEVDGLGWFTTVGGYSYHPERL